MSKETYESTAVLNEEIEKKCFEIRKKRQEKVLKNIFILSCIVFVLVPVICTILEISILVTFIPVVVLFGVYLILFLPISTNSKTGGLTYEKIR